MTRDQDAIALAERVLSILEEGSFSSTYKFALFIAILDLCMEKTSRSGVAPQSLTTRELAERVIELYWNHTVLYRGQLELRQGGVRSGSQAEILKAITRLRARWAGSQSSTVQRFRLAHADKFDKLVRFVEWKLVEMPISKLQVLGGREHRFLYEYDWEKNIPQSTVSAYQRGTPLCFANQLRLLHGVAENLVKLNGLLRPLFYREWAVKVARMNSLPEDELERFLFRPERVPLDAVRGPLSHVQDGDCFYCRKPLSDRADVDHFIPWSRYPDDGLDNLVVAHPKCNNSKRDFLAAAVHVEAWAARLRMHNDRLTAAARAVGWHRDISRITSVAAAIYLGLPESTRLWQWPDEFVLIERDRIATALAG